MDWEKALKEQTPRGLHGVKDSMPAASWADPDQLSEKWAYDRTSIFLGYRDINGKPKPIGLKDDRHVMLVAGSRAGKGLSLIVPNLMMYEGSVLAIDPKGELARLTAERRAAMGQKVVVLDPFDRSGKSTRPFRGSFNPLDELAPILPSGEIDLESKTIIDNAALLAAALIVGDGQSEQYWLNSARELVKVLILFALLQEPEHRNLLTVRKFFRSANGMRAALGSLVDCKDDAFDGLVSRTAATLLTTDERTLSNIVSTADVQLGFLDSYALAGTLRESSFKLEELRQQSSKVTVYLCLPAGRMATHAKWLRTVVSLALNVSEDDLQPNPPLLLLLEEFPVLGHMEQVEVAAGQIAGYGVKIWTVLQDLTQLERHYGKSWETFMGNSGVAVFFGNADVTTLDYVSRKLGTIGFDLKRATGNSPDTTYRGAPGTQDQLQVQRLLEPHEVELMFARDTNRALVLHSGHPPLVLRRANYRTDPNFRKYL